MKILYTAHATANEDGRTGHTRTDDGKVDFDLSSPKELGGDGGPGTNPEQLFAAGYAACFANAMRSSARRDGSLDDVKGVTVTAHVSTSARSARAASASASRSSVTSPRSTRPPPRTSSPAPTTAARTRTPRAATSSVELGDGRRLSRLRVSDDDCTPPRPRRAALGRRARGGALALPRHGHRPRPARRADRRHRLDVDADDAVQPQPPAARRGRSPRRSRRRAACRSSSTRSRSPTTSRRRRPGMRASLVSREVIADSIELMVHAHDFDALVCIVGCDKTVPAALMALARVDRPAVVLSGGPMLAGRVGRPRADDPGRVGGGRRARARADLARGARRDRARGVPRRRLLRRATSPPTRWRSSSTCSASA